MSEPREVWAYLVGADGEPVTGEVHAVLVPDEAGEARLDLDGVFESLPGREDAEPASIAFRFVDGHVATGEVPRGAWERVEWEEDEEGR